MLQLKKITKNYKTGDSVVEALKGVELSFRDNEFVSVLGPSGCGKTTLLNIIGGLDRYTSGDLIINGRSTKEYRDGDWDAYRNHSIGFVFQSYNLIPHQTVLSNVELALTLSGVSKGERKKRAKEALEKVGLGNQLHKKPSQMSGGQMQRVAIARALVNNPDILLADEPTGALDTATSLQIMEIMKEISKDKLIIMVTHNPELAEKYSTRIVKLLDGEVVDDTMPYSEEEAAAAAGEKNALREKSGKKKKMRSMSLLTALSLSMNNLLTKKTRTFMTSFAGSIGIIGIALILALSTGVQYYIDDVQRDTISSYPIIIEKEESDISAMMSSMSDASEENAAEPDHELDAVYENATLLGLFNSFFSKDASVNNLTALKQFIDSEMTSENPRTELADAASAIRYEYDVSMNNFVLENGEYRSANISDVFTGFAAGNSAQVAMMSKQMKNYSLWDEILPGENGEAVSDLIKEQYDVVYGQWPSSADEIVLILNSKNEISDMAFYSLGLVSGDEIADILSASMSGKKIDIEEKSVSYADLCNIRFKMLLNTDFYSDTDGNGVYEYCGDDETFMEMKIAGAYELKIVGVVRLNPDVTAGALTSTFGYTSALTEYIVNSINASELAKAQTAPENANMNLLSGLPFEAEESVEPSDEEKAVAVKEYFASLTDSEKKTVYEKILSDPSQDSIDAALSEYMKDFPTRESMVELVASTYGMDPSQAAAYLDAYTDDELKALIEEQITAVLKDRAAANAQAQILEIEKAPSDEELAALKAQITASLDSAQTKIGFVAASWAGTTGMDANAAMKLLMEMTPEELAAAVDFAAQEQAKVLYSQYSGMTAGYSEAKVAAAFDEFVEKTTDVKTLTGYYDLYMPASLSEQTYDEVLEKLGVFDLNAPSSISIYASTFENKDKIAGIIEYYNNQATEEDQITYTDYIALLMSGITTIINAISYGLIAFVSISLVVSSIMIGIITYISVLERTKEIGILRSIGASKRDIRRVFNAETLIVGFCAGALGIGVSLLLCLPLNLIIHSLSGIDTINAQLTPVYSIALVLISMVLTLIAGLIPSGVAAKKDPVEALRTD